MTDRPDPRQEAARWRASATRLRRAADRADAIADHPRRHPTPTTIPGLPTDDQIAAYLARHHPALARRAAEQYRSLADAHDRQAAHLIARSNP